MQALRLFIPGEYEDVFVYMDQLVAVGTDRSLLRMNLSEILDETVPSTVRRLAYLWFERNDLLSSPGTQALLSDQNVRQVVESALSSNADAFLVEPKWTTSDDYERLLGDATVLDLQIYAQRVFVGTTQGLMHANLINDGYELHFAGVTKRTDARCVGVSIRYGAVAASCEDDGLLMSFDEFGELEPHADDSLESVATVSQRSAWLGYNIVNYRDSSHAEGLRAQYRTVPERTGRRRDVVLTHLEPDDRLLGPVTQEWDDRVDFVFNAHSQFFIHRESGQFEVHRRSWWRNRLGAVQSTWSGEMDRPLSIVSAADALAIETYDAVWLLGNESIHKLYEGESIVLRSFPNSVRYRNLVAIVDSDGMYIISPFLARDAQD